MKLLEHGRQRLDRYELVAEIAAGGMATVYLARILGAGGFQRFVAIKRLHPHLAGEQEFIEMFLDEARLAASIHHPNVVPILEVGTSDRGYYLVMEYIEGDTMARLLARATTARERIPAPIVLRIILDALAGLHAAHELRDDQNELLGLVHRDVSPQNILVGADGTSRITDFGVARAATRLSSTRVGQLKGKLAYMAPEQAGGGAIDRRADIFAIGTVLWESLADKRLFKGEAEADTLRRVLYEPIPPLRSVAPYVPATIEAVVMKALQREPDQRYGTALDFSDDLERAARMTHLLASTRELSTYVQNAIGQDIAQQREAVRAWLAQSEPSRTDLDEAETVAPRVLEVPTSAVTSTSVSSPPAMLDDAESGERPVQTRNAGRPLWVAVALVGLALLAGIAGGFLAFGRRPPIQGAAESSTRGLGTIASPPVSAASVGAALSGPPPSAGGNVPAPPLLGAAAASSGAGSTSPESTTPPTQKSGSSSHRFRNRDPAPDKPAPPANTSPHVDEIPRNPYR